MSIISKFFFIFLFILNSQVSAEDKRWVVILDPGHGGEELGAVGHSGIHEKDLVLEISKILGKLLEENLNAVVRYTRQRDYTLPLQERTALANDYEADVFISLHANASQSKKLNGFEVYYLDNTNNAQSKRLAEAENAHGSMHYEGDLGFIIGDLIQNSKMADSIKLAKSISTGVDKFVLPLWKNTKNLGVKRAPFYVLMGAHMPCVLAELFFIDNKLDGRYLADDMFKRDLAYGLYYGIEQFLKSYK